MNDDSVDPEVEEDLKRTAWRPVVEEESETSARSRFGGRPWVPHGESWPECGICNEPAPLFLQLDLADLPEQCRFGRDSGLVQLFYCIRLDSMCELECNAWEPFSANTVTR